MDGMEIRARDLSDEEKRTFREAARERGAEAVVTWEGRPHLVSGWQDRDGNDERFTLEPIPRPFG